MARPRYPLSRTNPGLSGGQLAVTLADMGAQILDQTFVAGSAGGVNAVLHSLGTTNVFLQFYPAAGMSTRISWAEASAPTLSNVYLSISAVNDTGQNLNTNIYGRLAIFQRA